MPDCPNCGRQFSSFSFGSNPSTECPECRKTHHQIQIQLEPPANSAEAAAAPIQQPARIAQFAAKPIVTLTIMGLNVLVYIAMGASGVSWTAPSSLQAIRWGADFGPLTLAAEPWRLLTNMFVHFGIIHIALNMWCLFNLGQLLEPLMGRKRFGVMYVASGLAASIVSVAWNPWRVSAGASGAIFGVAGALVTYLAMKKTPFDKDLVRNNLKSLAIFIGYNLLYGLSGGVDNSAHIGGLVSGLILGAVIPPPRQRLFCGGVGAGPPVEIGSSEGAFGDAAVRNVALGSALLLVLGFFAVRKVNMPAVHYGRAVQLARAGNFDQGADEMQQAVALNPKLLLGQALLGEMRLAVNNPSAAIAPLEQAKALVPNAFDIRNNLALAYLGSGRLRDANAEIVAALPSEKKEAWRGCYILAKVEQFAGQYLAASQNYQQALKLKPDFAEAQTALTELRSTDTWKAPAALSPPIPLPYSTLMIKSDAWPYYP